MVSPFGQNVALKRDRIIMYVGKKKDCSGSHARNALEEATFVRNILFFVEAGLNMDTGFCFFQLWMGQCWMMVWYGRQGQDGVRIRIQYWIGREGEGG